MEDPRAKLNEALKEAMKNKDNQRRDVIRMVLSGIKQVEVDTRKELAAEDVVTVLQKEIKTRRESIEESRKAGRLEQIDAQQEEVEILEGFLPKQLSREEIAVLAKEAIAEAGATSVKEMGKVMGFLMPKVKGVADGKLVNEVVRELLS
jgi:uncharacterized protein YqeY